MLSVFKSEKYLIEQWKSRAVLISFGWDSSLQKSWFLCLLIKGPSDIKLMRQLLTISWLVFFGSNSDAFYFVIASRFNECISSWFLDSLADPVCVFWFWYNLRFLISHLLSASSDSIERENWSQWELKFFFVFRIVIAEFFNRDGFNLSIFFSESLFLNVIIC